MRKPLLLLSVCLLSTLSAAHATSLVPGSTVPASSLGYPSNNNLQLGFFDQVITTPTFSAHYAVQVFTDPSNVYCSGCLDFVYAIGSLTSGQVHDFVVGSFGGYHTSVGFSGPFGVDPTSISRSVDGQLIDFTFGNPIVIDPVHGSEFSSRMVIQTDATNFEFGPALGSLASNDRALQPVATPEPGTLMLFGTGLAGLAGVLRRKLTS